MQSIGPYTLTQQIGEGGFATVYLATDESGQPFALKHFITRHGEHIDRAKAKNERTCLERFDHPNVLALKDIVRRAQRSRRSPQPCWL